MQTQKAKTKVKKREREKGFIARIGVVHRPSRQDGAEQRPYKQPELDCCGVGRGRQGPVCRVLSALFLHHNGDD